jgi:hypothetical protein
MTQGMMPWPMGDEKQLIGQMVTYSSGRSRFFLR